MVKKRKAGKRQQGLIAGREKAGAKKDGEFKP